MNELDLKTQLDEMRIELKQLSADILKLTVINEHQYEERQSNSIKLDKLDTEFTQAKGAILLLKGILTFFGASAIAFCTWIVTNNNEQQKELYIHQQRIAVLENDINDLQESIKNATIKP